MGGGGGGWEEETLKNVSSSFRPSFLRVFTPFVVVVVVVVVLCFCFVSALIANMVLKSDGVMGACSKIAAADRNRNQISLSLNESLRPYSMRSDSRKFVCVRRLEALICA